MLESMFKVFEYMREAIKVNAFIGVHMDVRGDLVFDITGKVRGNFYNQGFSISKQEAANQNWELILQYRCDSFNHFIRTMEGKG